ncbi:MAG: cupin-like domain-containing protein [Myxococcaceae bacterium]
MRRMTSDLRLPRSWWRDFERSAWNKQPALLKNPVSGGFPTSDELFEGMLSAAHALRNGDLSEEHSFRLTLEHPDDPRRGEAGPLSSMVVLCHPYLPSERDGSLQNYVARLEETFAGFRFGLIFNSSVKHSWNHWLQMSSFLEGLGSVLGMPLAGADTAVFVGNYRYTPFGIHKDEYHVFNFVVHGEKKMCLWPLETFADRPEIPKTPDLAHRNANTVMKATELEAALKTAEVLVGQPGDIQYWPPSWWHIAPPSESLNVTISLGIAYRPPTLIPGIKATDSSGRLPAREVPDQRTAAHWPVPREIRATLPRASAAGRAGSSARTAALEGWLKLITGSGFNTAPALVEFPALGKGERIHAHPRRPIVVAEANASTFIVSCNGHACTMTGAAQLRRTVRMIVERLNRGRPVALHELESSFVGPKTALKKPALHALLQRLGTWRALERSSAAP